MACIWLNSVVDLVEAVEHAVLGEGIDGEFIRRAVRRDDDLRREVDLHPAAAGMRHDRILQCRDRAAGRTIGSSPFFRAFEKKMSPKEGADNGTDAVIVKRPHRMLARRAAAEILLCDQDRVRRGRPPDPARKAFRWRRPARAHVDEQIVRRNCRSAASANSARAGFDPCRHSTAGSEPRRREELRISSWLGLAVQELAHIGQAAGHRRGCGPSSGSTVGARSRPLPPDEIAIGGGGTALAGRYQIAICAQAHRAAGMRATRIPAAAEHAVQPLRFRLALDEARSGHHPALRRPRPPCGP